MTIYHDKHYNAKKIAEEFFDKSIKESNIRQWVRFGFLNYEMIDIKLDDDFSLTELETLIKIMKLTQDLYKKEYNG